VQVSCANPNAFNTDNLSAIYPEIGFSALAKGTPLRPSSSRALEEEKIMYFFSDVRGF
jgi:hypothetical protein